MSTLVISDLHLGAANRVDLLSLERPRELLLAEVARSDRVVLLGDLLELRDRPLADVLEIAAPFLAALGETARDRTEIVITGGNHDHHLFRAGLERRALAAEGPLGLTHEFEPEGALARLAELLAPARVRAHYPGLWLRDDVYATHGHYLDPHITLPTFERLAVGTMERILGRLAGEEITPDDHEAVQSPVYSLMHALAQARNPDQSGSSSAAVRLWSMLGGAHGKPSGIRGRLLGSVVIPGAVGVANRLGLGPVNADVSGAEVAESGARAMRLAIRGLGVEAEHVIFGHTHRRGPLPRDPAGPDWQAPGEPSLHNTGAWTYTPVIMDHADPTSPYWPGSAIRVPESGPPELLELLNDLTAAELSGDAAER